MSREIDKRIIEMEFDNREFERRIATTTGSLDKLQQSLMMTGATDGFDRLQAAITSVDFNGIIKGSTAAIMKIRLVKDAVDDLYGFAKRTFNSIVVDPPTAGWKKYEDITKSTQTIMAATAKDFEDEEEQMKVVNEQLEKLNWFTDETSYNLADMTNNIGKFTSNGVKLDTAVTAMEGIGTWASISGATIPEASRAMYNLSQALSTGSVKLIDWKSIENANMATYEFKQNVIDTAVQLGTLKQVSDGTFETAEGHKVSATNFNEFLKEEWFSSEVLLKVLNKYGGFTDKLNEYYNKFEGNMLTSDMLSALEAYKEGNTEKVQEIANDSGVALEDLTEMVQELSKAEYDLGLKSFRAAQEAKTLTEAIEATQDAVSTAWMSLWKTIFGDYKEAKKVWTAVANELYDVFAQPIWDIQAEIETWANKENPLSGLTGRMEFLTSIGNIWKGFTTVLNSAKEALSDFFGNVPLADTLADISHAMFNFSQRFALTDEQAEKLTSALKGLLKPIKFVKDLVVSVVKGFKPLVSIVGYLVDSILPGLVEHGEIIGKLFDGFADNGTLDKITKKISSVVEFITRIIKGYIRYLSRVFGVINRAVTVGVSIFTTKLKTGGDIVESILSGITYGISSFSKNFFNLISEITGIEWFKQLGEGTAKKWQAMLGGISKTIKSVKDTYKSALAETGSYTKAISKGLIAARKGLVGVLDSTMEASPFVGKIYKRIKDIIKTTVLENTQLQNTVKRVKSVFKGAKDAYKQYKEFGNARRGVVVATNTVIRSLGAELTKITGNKWFAEFGNNLAGSIDRAYTKLSRFGATLTDIYRTNGGGKQGFLHALFYGTGTVGQKIFDSLSKVTGIKWFSEVGNKINSYFEGLRAKIPGIMEKYAGVFDFVTNIFNVVKTAIDEAKNALVNAFHWLIGDDAETVDPLAPVADAVESSKERINVAYKSVKDMALEFIRGDWGNGEERDAAVLAAGYDNDKIQGVVNQVWSLYGDWKEGADEILAQYENVDARLEKATDGSKTPFKPLVDKPSAKKAKKNISGVVEMTDNLSESVEQINEKEPIRTLGEQMADLRDKVLAYLPTLLTNIGKGMAYIKVGVQTIISKVVDFIEKHAIIDKIVSGAGKIKKAFVAIFNFLKKYWPDIKNFGSVIFKNFQTYGTKIWKSASSIFSTFWKYLKVLAPAFEAIFAGIIRFDPELLKSGVSMMFESAKAAFKVGFANLGTSIDSFVNGAADTVQGILRFIRILLGLEDGESKEQVDPEKIEETTEDVKESTNVLSQTVITLGNTIDEVKTSGFLSEDTLTKVKQVVETVLGIVRAFTVIRTTKQIGGAFEAFGSIGKVFESTSGVLDTFGKSSGRIAGSFEDISKSMVSLTQTINKKGITALWKQRDPAKKFKDFAISFALIAASIVALGYIAPEDLDRGLQAALKVGVGLLAFYVVIKIIDKVIPSNPHGLQDVAKSLLEMAIALGILLLAVFLFSRMDTETLVKGFGAVGLALIGLVIAANLLRGKSIMNAGKTLILTSIALIIMSYAVSRFGKMDTKQLVTGLAVVGLLLLGLAIFANLLRGKNMMNVGKTLILTSIALIIMSFAVAKFGSMDMEQLKTGLASVGLLLLGIAIFANLIRGKNMMKVGGTILVVAIAINLLVFAVSKLGNMDQNKLHNGLVAVGALMLGLSIMMFAARGLKAGSFIGMIGIVLMLVAVIGILNVMKVRVSDKRIKAVAILMGTLAIVALVMSRGMKSVKDGWKAAFAMLPFVGILALILVALKYITPPKISVEQVEAISLLMGAVALVAIVASRTTRKMTDGWKAAFAMLPFVGVLAGLMLVLNLVPAPSMTLEQAESLSLIFVSVGGIAAVLMGVHANLASGVNAALGLVGFLGVLALAVMAIAAVNAIMTGAGNMVGSWLESVTGLNFNIDLSLASVFESAMPAIQALGEAIGSFIGGIKTALGIGENKDDALAATGEGIKTFFEEFPNPDQDTLDNVDTTVSLLAGLEEKLPPAGGLTQLWFGSQSWSTISTGLADFGTALAGFATAVSGGTIDAAQIEAVIPAATALAGLENQIPKADGFVQAITGETKWSTLSVGLAAFGRSLAAFSKAITGKSFDAQAILDMIPAATAIIGLENQIPKVGGLSQAIEGETKWSTVTDGLLAFGIGLSAFSLALTAYDFDADAILEMVPAAEAIVGLENKIPKTGGLAQAIEGEIKWSTVTDGLLAFGANLSAFSIALSAYGFDADAILEMAPAAQAVVELETKIPGTGGFYQKLFGEQGWNTVTTGLVDFAFALVRYSKQAGKIETENISNTLDVAQNIVDLHGKLPLSGGVVQAFTGEVDIEKFKENIVGLVGAMLAYQEEAKGITMSVDDPTVKFAESLASILTSSIALTTEGSWGFIRDNIVALITGLQSDEQFAEASLALIETMQGLAGDGVGAFSDEFDSVNTQVKYISGIQTMADNIDKDLIEKPVSAVTDMKTSFEGLADSLAGAFAVWFSTKDADTKYETAASNLRSHAVPKMFEAGRMISSGIASGMNSNLHLVASAAIKAAETVATNFNVRAEIESPSRMMWRSGRFLDMGLANGITDNLGTVNAATASMFSVIDQAMNSMSDTANPVITPVVDMSNIDQSAARINGMFSGGTWIARNNMDTAQSAMIGRNPEFRDFNLESRPINYAETLNNITAKIDQLSSAMSNMQVMLDGRKLVGSLTPSMDRSLGQRAMHIARRN